MKKQDILENQAKIVYLGIGSNLGDRKKNIEIAKSHLSEKNLDFLSISSFYETPSWPDPKKPKFLNVVIHQLKIDIILFSPGGESFDQFKNYSHRGLIFNKYIKKFKI